ncbi:phosphoribosylaminoimidazole-succinocarboxamide synthase [Arthrobacter stackebrandtii]|uniref:Phosphoribosylaminoimidazole-succinocarboxamide synthase n=1 Tax=Arthrobacter stackebrandtii TaxID=272161 RepID=A0ABS4YV02_9MICC|nr:phosphoribosylaminoimidazolesuccinocarboxamide synthase [Arthrobacter stackebrandtii]MBP2412425.1 phosphoribosylaminoimidazole-succinocarboxamide synthase [Arthrobacter stackebrandtii]PYH02191.1 phosphoribosylaminoimidazolesuccinocarboxamide synthase [Arthrobacter stackebrandtii]
MTSGTPAAPVLPGWTHIYSGKVRDLYVPNPAQSPQARPGALGAVDPTAAEAPFAGRDDVVLVVASDRISAFDHVLSTEIPDKGRILTGLSLWWFEQLNVPNHLVATTVEDGVPAAVAGRAMVCKKLEMFPIECISRGYLTGSGLIEYRESQTVCSLPLPAGLVDGSRLDEAIFTPSAKAEVGEHDENITFEKMVDTVGAAAADALRALTLEIYSRAEEIARERGIILADTKVEFGTDPATGVITLGDEVLTPDSSRFWDAELWAPGKAQPSFDKQYVRDWLASDASGWDRASDTPPPALPADVVERTRARYVEAYERLTGATFV